jgi:hypothetical protein
MPLQETSISALTARRTGARGARPSAMGIPDLTVTSVETMLGRILFYLRCVQIATKSHRRLGHTIKLKDAYAAASCEFFFSRDSVISFSPLWRRVVEMSFITRRSATGQAL